MLSFNPSLKLRWDSLTDESRTIPADYKYMTMNDVELEYSKHDTAWRAKFIEAHVFGSFQLPYFIHKQHDNMKVSEYLHPLYWHCCDYLDNTTNNREALTFGQFKVLHSFFLNSKTRRSMPPMSLSPPEYWYQYRLMTTPRLRAPNSREEQDIDINLAILNGPMVCTEVPVRDQTYVDYFFDTPKGNLFYNLEHAGSKNDLSFVPSANVCTLLEMGSVTNIKFWSRFYNIGTEDKTIVLRSFLDVLGVNGFARKMTAFPAYHVRHDAICLKDPAFHMKTDYFAEYDDDHLQYDPPESYLNYAEEDLRMVEPLPKGKSFETVYDFESDKLDLVLMPYYSELDGPEVVTIPYQPLDQPKLLTNACPSESCCADIGCEKYLRVNGTDSWLTLMNGLDLHAPDLNFVANKTDFEIITQPVSTVFQSSGQLNADLIPCRKTSYVLCDSETWREYLSVDARVAENVDLKFYGVRIGEEHTLAPRAFHGTGARLLDVHVLQIPSTFNKFAWLFNQYGFVNLDSSGNYPFNMPVQNPDASVFEVGAAPYGACMAALESGLTGVYCYVDFRGESQKKLHSRYASRVRDFSSDFGGSTDINGIASFIEKNPELNYTKHSMLILDLPLHRNSNSAHTGKNLRADKEARKALEFVDDIPLGKSGAMCARLASYGVLISKLLVPGGSVIIKLLEYANSDVAINLFKIVSSFKNIALVRNPFSKTLTQEVYVVGSEYSKGVQGYREFIDAYIAFVNVMIYRQTLALLLAAHRYGSKFRAKRTISCRRRLFQMTCLSFSTFVSRFNYQPALADNRLNAGYFSCEKSVYELAELKRLFPQVPRDVLQYYYPNLDYGKAVAELIARGFVMDGKLA